MSLDTDRCITRVFLTQGTIALCLEPQILNREYSVSNYFAVTLFSMQRANMHITHYYTNPLTPFAHPNI